MSAISLKSITGITSITTPAGVDNQLTLHTNNTVERLRIASDGNVGVNTSSVSIAGMSRYLSVSARNVTNGGAAVELVGARTGSDQTLGVINFVNQTSKVAEIRSKYQGSTTLGSLHFQTSGTERLQITSTGDLSLTTTTQNAFLGLKANSTAINLTLGSTDGTHPRAYFYGTGNGQSTAGDIFLGAGVGGELRFRAGQSIKLQTNSDNSTIDAFFIHAAGTVAVNTLSPDTTYKLDVAGAGQFTTSATNQQNDFNTGQLTVRNNQSAQGAFIDFRADSANGTQGVISKIGGFNVHSGSGYDGLLTFSTRQNSSNAMVERMRIKHDGYVGIATNNPVNQLHVEGLNTVARFSSSSSYVDIKLQNSSSQLGFIQYNGTQLRFFANSGSTPTIYIPDTKFGVNTVPDTTLHIKDAVPEIRLTSSDASLTSSEIVGKLSFHTSDPTTPTGAGQVSYIETFSATSNGSDYTTSISNRAGAGGGETRIRLGNALGQIRFYTNTSGNGLERVRIDSSGILSVGTAPASGAGLLNIKPRSDADTFIKFRKASDFDASFDGTAIDNRNSANNQNRDLIVRFGKMAIWAGGTEKYRIGTAGQFGIGGSNYGTAGQVLTSTGSSSGLSWSSVFNGALDGMIFGGTETTYTSGGTTYKVHTFLATGFLRVTAATTMDFLIVAGGGGSAAAELSYGATGGGGAGGMVVGTSITIPAGKHTVTVGAGGAASNAYNVAGSGGDSTFAYGGTTVTAKGGAGSPDYATTGQNGGSGSGGSEPSGSGGSSTQSSQNSGISNIQQYGNAGGAASGYQSGAGGGGGAGGAGQSRSSGGGGGAGRANSITGSSVTYAVGGNGGPPSTYTNATAGTNGRGNGASGASSNHPNEGQGAVGGSGIIIVRYVLT